MTSTLRRAHRVIWFLLAIVLPVGLVAALRLTTLPPVQEQPIGSSVAAPLPVLVKSVAEPGLLVNLRQGGQPPIQQLEIVVRQPMEVPSVVVRVGAGANGLAIGTLDVAGVYRFPLPNSAVHPTITLTDDVHHTILKTIHF